MEEWKFADAPSLAVIVNKKILNKDRWIAYVTHDNDDGGWQFHSSDAEFNESDAAIVSLQNIVEIDESINYLCDLPLGWHAWRESKEDIWKRAPQE